MSEPKKKLTEAQVNVASEPEARDYHDSGGVMGVVRSVVLDGRRVYVDRESYDRVCTRLGVKPDARW